MERLFNHIFALTFGLTAAFMMASCDTDVESVDINEPDINNQNSALYAQYLENLRNYKNSSHKYFVAYFDNSEKQPFSQGQIFSAAPDSIDYLALTSPSNLTDLEIQEMNEVKTTKCTKLVYKIDFDEIKTDYENQAKAFAEDSLNKGKTFIGFNDYLVDSVKTALTYCEKYNFDGIIMAYQGKAKLYMSEEDKIAYTGYENDFIGIAIDWAQRHTDKTLIFQGKPQNVINQEIFSLAQFVIIPCNDVESASRVTLTMLMAAEEGVPSDRFVPLVSMYSLDKTDEKTGYWLDGTLATLGIAKWAVSVHEVFSVVGIAVENANNDYYHADFTYPNVRKAISIINPNVKN